MKVTFVDGNNFTPLFILARPFIESGSCRVATTLSLLPAGASRPMAQPVVQPPVTYVSLVSNYPSPRAKRERKPLSEVLTPNQPAVLHLFTG